MPHRRFNTEVSALFAEYNTRACLLRQGSAERVTATKEIVAQSLALIARIAELDANFTAAAKRAGWLWPAYLSTAQSPAR